MTRRTTWLIAAAFGLLLTTLAFSAWRYRGAQDQAGRAAEQARQVQMLSDQVRSLTDNPAVAVAATDGVQQLSGVIETAAQGCQIQPTQIGSISAQAPRRVGQSPYYRLPTRVEVQGVALPQLVDLLHRLTEGGQLTLADCRLSAPHGEVVGQTWNAEFTLAYLVYDPDQNQPPR